MSDLSFFFSPNLLSDASQIQPFNLLRVETLSHLSIENLHRISIR